MNKAVFTNTDIAVAANKVALKIAGRVNLNPQRVWGIPRSGVPAAYIITSALNDLGVPATLVNTPDEATLIVDDLVDSGATISRYSEKYRCAYFACLFSKQVQHDAFPSSAPYYFGELLTSKGMWITFPWDVSGEASDTSAFDAVTRMLQYIGEDPQRGGLLETPKRVVKAWDEWFSGYKIDPSQLLKTFEDGAEGVNEMVLLTDIPVMSHCEHHVAPFTGVAHVAYIPAGRIVGLSKIARVVDAFSRRLQVQERLTNQIADCFMNELKPLGAAVVIKAKHSCMSSRGVKVHSVDTTTSALRGVFMTDQAVRAEFMHLTK